jgi:hypothetical protein
MCPQWDGAFEYVCGRGQLRRSDRGSSQSEEMVYNEFELVELVELVKFDVLDSRGGRRLEILSLGVENCSMELLSFARVTETQYLRASLTLWTLMAGSDRFGVDQSSCFLLFVSKFLLQNSILTLVCFRMCSEDFVCSLSRSLSSPHFANHQNATNLIAPRVYSLSMIPFSRALEELLDISKSTFLLQCNPDCIDYNELSLLCK